MKVPAKGGLATPSPKTVPSLKPLREAAVEPEPETPVVVVFTIANQ
jgi:hypothetical protein